MARERQYFDIDGNPCSLDALCQKEPAWAANRIRAMQRELDEATPGVLSADRCNCGEPEWCPLCIDIARRKAHGEFISHLIEPNSEMVPEPEWIWVNVYAPGECEWYAYPNKRLAVKARSEGAKTFAFTRGHELERRFAQAQQKIAQLQVENLKLHDELVQTRQYEKQRNEVVMGCAKQWTLEECGRRCTSLWKSNETQDLLAEYLSEFDVSMFFSRLEAGQTVVKSHLQDMTENIRKLNLLRKERHLDDPRCKRLMEHGWDDAKPMPDVPADPDHVQAWLDVLGRVLAMGHPIGHPRPHPNPPIPIPSRPIPTTWGVRQAPQEESETTLTYGIGFSNVETALGKVVRETWIEWAKRQPDVGNHPNWLTPWEALPDRDKDVDCLIGRAVSQESTRCAWAYVDELRERLQLARTNEDLARSSFQGCAAALLIIMMPVCRDCKCLLEGPWDPDSFLPPHCEGCVPEDEADNAWDNERKHRLAVIKRALDTASRASDDRLIVRVANWKQRFEAPCGCVCTFDPHLEVLLECESHRDMGMSWIFKR